MNQTVRESSLTEVKLLEYVNNFFDRTLKWEKIWGNAAKDQKPDYNSLRHLYALIRDYEKFSYDSKLVTICFSISFTHSKVFHNNGFSKDQVLKCTEVLWLMLEKENKEADLEKISRFFRRTICRTKVGTKGWRLKTKLANNGDSLHFLLWMCATFGIEGLNEQDESFSLLQWYYDKLTANEPWIIFLLNDVFKKYFEVCSCELDIRKNFLLDLPDFVNLLDVEQVKEKISKNEGDLLGCYSALVNAVLLKDKADKPPEDIWIDGFWDEEDMVTRVFRVIIDKKHRLNFFRHEQKQISPTMHRFVQFLKESYSDDFLKKDAKASLRKRMSQAFFCDQNSAGLIKPNQQSVEIPLVSSMHFERLVATIQKIHFGTASFDQFSTVECLQHHNSTAFSIALLLLKSFIRDNNETTMQSKEPENACCQIFVVTSTTDTTNLLQEFVRLGLLVSKQERWIRYTTGKKDEATLEIRFGTTEEIEKDVKKLKKKFEAAKANKKALTKSFGILVNDPLPRQHLNNNFTKFVTLTPLMLTAWIHAKLYLKFNAFSQRQDVPPDAVLEITKAVLKHLSIILEGHTFDNQLVKEHAEVTLSIALGEGNYKFLDQEKIELNKTKRMKEMFGNFWISVKEPCTVKKTSKKKKKKEGPYDVWIHKANEKFSKWTWILADKEDVWLKNVRMEALDSQRQKAVVVTATWENFKKLKTHFDQNQMTIKSDTNEGDHVEILAGQILLLDIGNNVTVASKAEIHFISCTFPLTPREHCRLSGNTLCYDSVYSQRYILCKEHLTVDIKYFIEHAFRNGLSNIVELYIRRLEVLDLNSCWIAYDTLEAQLQATVVKQNTLEAFTDRFYMLLKCKTDYLNEDRQITEKLKFYGKTDYSDLLYKNFLENEQSYLCRFTNIKNIQTYGDIVNTAIFAAKCRTDDETVMKQMVMHFPEDPEQYFRNSRQVTFKNRTGFEVELDALYNVLKITMVRASFTFFPVVPGQPLSRAGVEVNQMAAENSVVIYESISHDKDVDNYLDRLLRSRDALNPILTHHEYVKDDSTPPDVIPA